MVDVNWSSGQRPKISKQDWEEKLSNIHPSREDLNKLVMNFLVVEGYKAGALKFEKEAGVKANLDEHVDHRIEIRKMIQCGMIQEAMDSIKGRFPDVLNYRQLLQVLDGSRDLEFQLKKQQLVELIKAGKTEEAIDFAQERIANDCKGRSAAKYQEEIEKVMTLLMYEDPGKSPLKDLVDQSSRQKLASDVNSAILRHTGDANDVKLDFYYQLLQWSQKQLKEKLEFPEFDEL